MYVRVDKAFEKSINLSVLGSKKNDAEGKSKEGKEGRFANLNSFLTYFACPWLLRYDPSVSCGTTTLTTVIGKRRKYMTKKWSPWSWVHSLLNYRIQIKIVRKHFVRGVFTAIAIILARIGNLSTSNGRFCAFIIFIPRSSQSQNSTKILRTSKKSSYGYMEALAKTEVPFEWPDRRILSIDSENKGRTK